MSDRQKLVPLVKAIYAWLHKSGWTDTSAHSAMQAMARTKKYFAARPQSKYELLSEVEEALRLGTAAGCFYARRKPGLDYDVYSTTSAKPTAGMFK